MSERFDLIVMGTGTAAQGVARRVRGAGRSVAIIDDRPFGGTCALRGCDPKKVLVGVASAVDHARRLKGKGLVGMPRIDWPELIAFKRGFTDPVPERQAESYAETGIAAFHGHARFMGPKRVEVEGAVLEAPHILIATGAMPARLGIPGEEHLTTSDDFLTLKRLPERIVMVGGGYIAAELSHIAARAGAQVTVLQRGERMLARFEPELVGWLMEAFEAVGIEVRTDTAVKAVEKTGAGYRVAASSSEGDVMVEADLVVHAAGRAPHLEGLGLDSAGVAVKDGRLRLNAYLQSVSNPAVYAAGDAAQAGPPLTPVSGHDAQAVAGNLIDGNRHRPDYRGVPSVAFTMPPIAAVGLSEEEALQRGLSFDVKKKRGTDWYTARQAAEPVYGFKTLLEKGSGRILGAHLVGPHADEVINLLAMAIRHDLTAATVKEAIFAYPTGASDLAYML